MNQYDVALMKNCKRSTGEVIRITADCPLVAATQFFKQLKQHPGEGQWIRVASPNSAFICYYICSKGDNLTKL